MIFGFNRRLDPLAAHCCNDGFWLDAIRIDWFDVEFNWEVDSTAAVIAAVHRRLSTDKNGPLKRPSTSVIRSFGSVSRWLTTPDWPRPSLRHVTGVLCNQLVAREPTTSRWMNRRLDFWRQLRANVVEGPVQRHHRRWTTLRHDTHVGGVFTTTVTRRGATPATPSTDLKTIMNGNYKFIFFWIIFPLDREIAAGKECGDGLKKTADGWNCLVVAIARSHLNNITII